MAQGTSDASGASMVAIALLVLLALAAGAVWAFHHFSSQQRCIRAVVAERKRAPDQAAAWCQRNARWT